MLDPEATQREVGSCPRCCGELANHRVNCLLEPTQSQEPPRRSSEAVIGGERGPKALGRGERREKQNWKRKLSVWGRLGVGYG